MTLTPVATATVTAKHADWMKVLRLAKLTIPAGRRFYRLPVLSQLYLAPAGALGCLHRTWCGKCESTLAAVFDLETSVQLLLPTAVCSGPMLLPAAELWPVMRELARDRGAARVAWEPVTVSAPNGRNVRVRGLGRDVNVPWDEALPVADYPNLPTVHGPALARVDVPALQAAWKFTAAAAGKDSIALPALTGVRMEFDSRPVITLAATDKKRLAVAELSVDERLPARDEAQLLVPAVLGRHLQHLVDDVTIRVTKDTVIFTDNPSLVKPANGMGVITSITARLLDATFPAYRNLIPDVTVHRWKLPREELIADLRVAAAARQRNEPVPVVFTSKHVQVEGGPQRPVWATTSGTVRSAFNPRFLLDVLTGFTGRHVICRAVTAVKPFLFEGNLEPDHLAGQLMLMPIRLPG